MGPLLERRVPEKRFRLVPSPRSTRDSDRLFKMLLLLVAACATTILFALSAIGCGGSDRDEVTLQLNWFHEAEFVGYYMADAQGFFEDQNLDVSILEGGPGTPARDQAVSGAATFAVTSFAEQRDLIVAGQPTLAVMSAFQIPPLVIFSLTSSNIGEPVDLIGKKVGTTTDYWKNVLKETLVAAGIDPAQVETVDVTPDQMVLLYDGTVDAWLGYAQDEPIKASIDGHPVTNIFPADFGVGGYEGLIITLDETVADQPDMVRRFLRACYDGWRYAVEHPDEAAEVLLKWAPENGLEFQKLAVRAVAPLVDTPQVPVGWIDTARWQQLMGEAWDPQHPGFTMALSPIQP